MNFTKNNGLSYKNKFSQPWYINMSITTSLGSGCGSVGRAVASNSRGLRFESSYRQKFILNIYCQLY